MGDKRQNVIDLISDMCIDLFDSHLKYELMNVHKYGDTKYDDYNEFIEDTLYFKADEFQALSKIDYISGLWINGYSKDICNEIDVFEELNSEYGFLECGLSRMIFNIVGDIADNLYYSWITSDEVKDYITQ
jgi:hypothetical protein